MQGLPRPSGRLTIHMIRHNALVSLACVVLTSTPALAQHAHDPVAPYLGTNINRPAT